MSDTPSPTFDQLDRRGRAAAAALRTRIDALVDDDAWPTPWRTGADGADPGDPIHTHDGDPHDHMLVVVEPAGGRRGGRRGFRRPGAWLAAAAIVVLVAAVAAIVTREPRTTVSSDQPRYLVPGDLPAGMELRGSVAFDGSTEDMAIDAEAVVYGDGGAADPWLAPTLLVLRQRDVDELTVDDFQGDLAGATDTILVGGHEAVVEQVAGPGAAGPESGPPTWQVAWLDGPDRVVVGGSAGMGRDQVVAAAQGVDGTEIPAAALPAGFVRIARGPLDAIGVSSLVGVRYASGVALTYMRPEDPEDGPAVSIVERPGTAEAVSLLRGAFPDSEPITVHGREGVIGRRDGMVVVQWLESDDILVTVTGSQVAEADVVAVAEGMRAATAGEVEGLIAGGEGRLGPVPDGQVEVAAGQTPGGGAWRLTADPALPEGASALTLEQATESDGVTSLGSAEGGGDGPPLEVATSSLDDATAIVYGTAAAEATSVTLEAPGRPPQALDLYAVEGWSRAALALAVPTGDLDGASLVARTADGTELARTPLG